MTAPSNNKSLNKKGISLWVSKIREAFSPVPLLGWLFAILIAVVLEQVVGTPLARALGMSKVPVLFGFVIILKQPGLIPVTFLYIMLIYVLPISIIARYTTLLANRLAAKLLTFPFVISVFVHLGLLYTVLHIWAGINDYRDLMVRLILIAIMITLSLNVVNGYMGEFSCSHPGFIEHHCLFYYL